MMPFSQLMTYSAQLSEREAVFPREIGSRFINTAGCVPFEASLVIYNTFKLPCQAVLSLFKLPPQVINFVISSKSMAEFVTALPGPIDVLETALKVVLYSLGTFCTLTIGNISPKKNFQWHLGLGMIRDLQAEADCARIEEEKNKERNVFETAYRRHLQSMLETLRRQREEREHALIKMGQLQETPFIKEEEQNPPTNEESPLNSSPSPVSLDEAKPTSLTPSPNLPIEN